MTNTNACMEQSADKCERAARKFDIKLLLVALVLIGIFSPMVWNSISSYSKGIVALQYKTADATVAKTQEIYDSFGIRKEAVMQFRINDAEHSVICPIPGGRVMKKGELTVLYYDKSDPSKAVLSKEIDYDPIIVNGAYGLFGLAFGVFILSRALKAPASSQ